MRPPYMLARWVFSFQEEDLEVGMEITEISHIPVNSALTPIQQMLGIFLGVSTVSTPQ